MDLDCKIVIPRHWDYKNTKKYLMCNYIIQNVIFLALIFLYIYFVLDFRFRKTDFNYKRYKEKKKTICSIMASRFKWLASGNIFIDIYNRLFLYKKRSVNRYCCSLRY